MNSDNLEQLKARSVAVLAPGEAATKKKLNKRMYNGRWMMRRCWKRRRKMVIEGC